MRFSSRRVAWVVLGLGTVGLLTGAAVMLFHTVADAVHFRGGSQPRHALVAYGRNSQDCRPCHLEIFQAWEQSHHGHAHRPVDASQDRDAFTPPNSFDLEGVHYTLTWKGDRPEFHEQRGNQPDFKYTAGFVLGYTPLRQYIVPVGGGRYQAAELSYDPAKKQWFDVFGSEQRQPGEWGHWQGRGMNWNSMCAQCHLTDYRKNYQPATDTYASQWLEHGVGCVQCHGDLTPDHATPGYKTPRELWQLTTDRQRNEQTCAPCHARNELLTGEPRPGMRYPDHFRVALPTEAAVFYPDGQVRDEDFNWTSLLTSRMGGKAGVTCLDCHEPHTGKTRLPAANNALCLQCHVQNNSRGAPAIDPTAHSHHGAESTGNQCIACHMPTTTYMQRDPRHDHGFLRPDPLLTKELAIPNACDRCHADKGIDWQITWTDNWYAGKMESRQRERARAVAAAQRRDGHAVPQLLALAASEEVPAWKATLLLVARPWSAQPEVIAAARRAITDADPLVRSAGAQLLSEVPAELPQLRPLLNDPVRLVRLDAASALSAELAPDSAARRELDAYLAVAADQPAGLVRVAQDQLIRGNGEAAEASLKKATRWDPNSAGIFQNLGLVEDSLGKSADAAAALWRAASLQPDNAPVAFQAGLAFAAAGKLSDAKIALEAAVQRDAKLDRAWYNLGLLLAQSGNAPQAIAAIQHAEQLAPKIADYPYARATILWQKGDRDGARAAARRALEVDPRYEAARPLAESR